MNKLLFLRISAISAAISSALAMTNAYAEEKSTLTKKEDTEIIVVTGTAGGGGITRKDASFAITIVSEDDIRVSSPKSTAELFASVPGITVESSGGVSGANIRVRGLPQGGDAPFVTMSINGAPIYGTETLSFMEHSSIFRVDETIEYAEALRGGPSAVFSNGEPGVTLNFNLKKGREDTEGRVKYTHTNYGLGRFDGVLSGELSDDLYFMVGGYVKSSPGIRDAQFTSEEGHQFTAQVTKKLDNGEINAWTRITDDHGQWYLPIALGTGNDLGTFSQLGNATRFRTLQVNAAGDTRDFDFSRGRGWNGTISGINANFDIGNGFTFRDNLSFTKGNAGTYGLVPDGAPVLVSSLATGSATTLGGDVLEGSEYVQNYGHWVVEKQLQSFTNDLSLNKKFGEHDITVGFYTASWSSKDFWTIGNFTPLHNVKNGDFLDDTANCSDLQDAGSGSGCWSYGINSSGDATTEAIYIADSWQFNDALRFDMGIRRETININYTLDEGSGYPDGTRDMAVSLSESEVAYTLAADYRFTKEFATFIRYSDGFLFPHFDDIRSNNNNVNGIEQLELGVKYSGEYIDVFANIFRNTNDSFSSLVGGVAPNSAFETEATGLEIDTKFNYEDFGLSFTGTVLDAEITNSTTVSDIGNEVQSQPKLSFRIAPSYTVEFGDVTANFYAAAQYVGEKFDGNANLVKLPSFTKVDIGVYINTITGLSFQIHADNISDSEGLTEGDPRSLGSPNGRPILGRSVKFSLGYDF